MNNGSTTNARGSQQQEINVQAGEERDADGFLRAAGSNGSTTFGRPEFEDAFYNDNGDSNVGGNAAAVAAAAESLADDDGFADQSRVVAHGEPTHQGGFVNDEEDLTDEDMDEDGNFILQDDESIPDAPEHTFQYEDEPYNDADQYNHFEEEDDYDDEDEMLEDEEIHISGYGDDSIGDLDHVHDNPHKSCIVSNLGMKSPAIREMNENEIYAKQAGLR